MVLALLALASLITVLQRMLTVRRQALAGATSATSSARDGLSVRPGLSAIADSDRGRPGGLDAVRGCPSAPAYGALRPRPRDLTHARGGRAGRAAPEPTTRRVRPDLDPAALDQLVARRAAVLPALLVRRVPAARTPRARADRSSGPACDGDGPVRAELAAGRPVLLPRPPRQLGHWPAPGAPITSVPSTPSPSGSSPRRCMPSSSSFRESLGMRILPLTGGGNVIGAPPRGHFASRSSCRCSPTVT